MEIKNRYKIKESRTKSGYYVIIDRRKGRLVENERGICIWFRGIKSAEDYVKKHSDKVVIKAKKSINLGDYVAP